MTASEISDLVGQVDAAANYRNVGSGEKGGGDPPPRLARDDERLASSPA